MAPTAQPYQARNGTVTWFVRYRIPGKSHPTKDTFVGPSAQVDAERYAKLVTRVGGAAARATRVSSEGSAITMPTLATWLETHLATVDASRAEGTAPEYRRLAARTWLPRLGSLPLDAITRQAVVSWVAWQREQETARSKAARARAAAAGTPVPEPKTYSPKSISHAQRLLSSVMASAVAVDLIVKNPAEGVQLPTDAEPAEMVYLTANEVARLIAAVTEPWRPFVAFLFGSGCRFGEATALVGGDFDLDAEQPIVRIARAWKKGDGRVYLGGPKSKRGVRTVTLDQGLADFIRPLVEAAGREGRVFTTRTGTRIQSQHFHTRVWTPALERAQLGKRPRVHDARHSHVAALMAQDISLPVIQRRLGHEDIRTTVNTYGHLAKDAHAGAAVAAGVFMAGALPTVEPLPQIEG